MTIPRKQTTTPFTSPTHMEITVIVAAGSGSRFGSELPKQFLPLAGKPMLMHTIEAFRKALPSGKIILVLSPGMIPLWEDLCKTHGMQSPQIAEGGASRWESVKHAIEALKDDPASATVLVHDGARPLVSADLIKRVLAYARNTDGALPAVPVTDSIRKISENGVTSEAVDRSLYRAVQTPQAFSLWRLREAYSLPYDEAFTDDASVIAAAGFENIVLVEGSPENIKVTTPIDMVIAETILSANNPKVSCYK